MKKWEKVLETNGVTFFQPVESLEETKQSMKRFYDRCNEIFKDRPELFENEKQLKKDKKNVFI